MNQAAARLLFGISALPETEYHAVFELIESMHSFIVPVMRILTEPAAINDKDFLWGL